MSIWDIGFEVWEFLLFDALSSCRMVLEWKWGKSFTKFWLAFFEYLWLLGLNITKIWTNQILESIIHQSFLVAYIGLGAVLACNLAYSLEHRYSLVHCESSLNTFCKISIFRRICLLDLGSQDICNWWCQLRFLEFAWASDHWEVAVLLVKGIIKIKAVFLYFDISINTFSIFRQYQSWWGVLFKLRIRRFESIWAIEALLVLCKELGRKWFVFLIESALFEASRLLRILNSFEQILDNAIYFIMLNCFIRHLLVLILWSIICIANF